MTNQINVISLNSIFRPKLDQTLVRCEFGFFVAQNFQTTVEQGKLFAAQENRTIKVKERKIIIQVWAVRRTNNTREGNNGVNYLLDCCGFDNLDILFLLSASFYKLHVTSAAFIVCTTRDRMTRWNHRISLHSCSDYRHFEGSNRWVKISVWLM